MLPSHQRTLPPSLRSLDREEVRLIRPDWNFPPIDGAVLCESEALFETRNEKGSIWQLGRREGITNERDTHELGCRFVKPLKQTTNCE